MRRCLGLPGEPCSAWVASGQRCAEHTRTASQRGYGSAWQRLRAQMLAEAPSCQLCGAIATQIDHIVPKSRGGSDARSNLRGLCSACHARKSAREAFQMGW